jgi:hypothetical protein
VPAGGIPPFCLNIPLFSPLKQKLVFIFWGQLFYPAETLLSANNLKLKDREISLRFNRRSSAACEYRPTETFP